MKESLVREETPLEPGGRRGALLLTVLIVALAAWWQPRASITDCDAEAYAMGASSLRAGLGYAEPGGDGLNHWPPGYSWLLSLFADATAAAWWINLAALGAASWLLFALAVRAGWSGWRGLALTAIVGGGFFMRLGHEVKPDVLAYAGFLAASLSMFSERRVWRVVGLALASVLIPVKLIAMTFAPGLLLADWIRLGLARFLKTRWIEVLTASVVWAAAVGFILWFNMKGLHTSVPQSHAQATLATFTGEIQRFVEACLRAGIAQWQGSIRPLPILSLFAVTLAAGIACLLTLRRNAGQDARTLWAQGWAVFALGWAMEAYRSFFAGPRLMGYGMLLLVLALRPALDKKSVRWLWVAYALLTLASTGLNRLTLSRAGINEPWIVAESHAAAASLPAAERIVYSNAWRLLDVHAARASKQVAALDEVPSGAFYWHMDKPEPNDSLVLRNVPEPGPGWEVIARLPHSTIYRKPQGTDPR